MLAKNESGGYVESIKKGLYQAYELIAKLFLDGSASAMVSNDGGFMMHLGGTSIQIKDFDCGTKLKKKSTITASFSSNELQVSGSTN